MQTNGRNTEPKPHPEDAPGDLELVFKALAHPARRRILVFLHVGGGEMSSGTIARRFPCAWPTTTRHLSVLREAGLVRVLQRGRERYYGLDRDRLQCAVGDWLRRFEEEPGSRAAIRGITEVAVDQMAVDQRAVDQATVNRATVD